MSSGVLRPDTLRVLPGGRSFGRISEGPPAQKVTVGCLVAVAAMGGAAEAQEQSLPPVTVDAPIARPKPSATKPSPEQMRARNALRRIAERAAAAARAKAEAEADAKKQLAQQDPFADSAAAYKADRLASPKFPEPILNTPRSITVLTQEVLRDKDATSLKDALRTTPGITIGTGEGGNAFGDRFFIRGFDARNDVFVDGIRDPAVNIRENFFTEQIEILKGPASTIDVRGTAGGAINIVTKQASELASFYNADTKFASDFTKRVTFDVNQVITPTLAVRMDGMWQVANVSERNFTTDDRWGGLAAVKWTPTTDLTVSANYIHTNLHGLPDFGVPYNTVAGAPVTSVGVPRQTYYGFVDRDFQVATQDIGTITTDYRVSETLTFTNKFRDEHSILNYIGTIPEQGSSAAGCNSKRGNFTNPNPAAWLVCLNPQSRYQVTDVLADQALSTLKFNTGPVLNTLVTGAEISGERVSIDSYRGLNSEAIGSGAFANGSVGPVSALNPPNFLPFGTPTVTGNPSVIPITTKSLWALETANWRELVIFTAGLRFDNYNISASKNGFPTVSAQSNMLNYNLGLLVKPLPNASVYAAYGTSSQPVGAELDGTSANYGGLQLTNSSINQIFGPTQAKAVEVGTKWEFFNRHLLATGALFRTDVSNAREVVPAGFPNAGTIQAGAAYHVQGIDIGAEGKILDKLSVFGGFVLMNNRVDASAVPTNVGLPLAFIADPSFNLLAKYEVMKALEVGAQATYRSKIYGGTLLAANQGTTLPDYWRFDAFVEGYFLKHYEWKLFVNNIFNKLYYDAFYQSAAPFVLVAPGRVVGGMLTAKF
jgi:catecholate siderophore receptor